MVKNGVPASVIVDIHTQLAMAGVSFRDVQELMGHRSYETTLQYAHLSADHVKQQVMKLPFAYRSEDSRTRIGHVEANSVDAKEIKKPCETLSSQGL